MSQCRYMELAASISTSLGICFFYEFMQSNPFSHLDPKTYTLSGSYALQDHKLLLKTRLEMKWAKLTGDRKKKPTRFYFYCLSMTRQLSLLNLAA